jgi:translocation and assembly module TamB
MPDRRSKPLEEPTDTPVRTGRMNSERPRAFPPDISEPHFVQREPEKRRTFKRVLHVLGAIVGTTATVLVATVGGVLLHIDLPPARRLLSGGLTTALAESFKGKLAIERIDRFGLGGFDGVVATVTGPDGKRVLLLDGVHARISLPRAAWSAIAGKGDMVIHVTEVGIDHVDAVIEQEPDGTLTVARAFEPKTPAPPPPPKAPPGRGIDLSLPKIAIRHAWVHGGIAAVPVIDADLSALDGAFGLDPKKTQLDLRRFTLSTRGLPQRADANGDIEAHLILPATGTGDMGASIAFVGTVGNIGAKVNGAIDGKKVDAVIDAPHIDPLAVQAMMEGAPLYQPASAHIEAHGVLPSITPDVKITVGAGSVDAHGQITIADDTNPDTRAEVTLEARNIDTRAFSPTAPASTIGARTTASAVVKPGGLVTGKYDLHVDPGEIAAQAIPATDVRGAFTQASVSGVAHVAEPGAPVDATFAVRVAPAGTTIDFDTRAKVVALRRVKRLAAMGTAVDGSVKLHTRGSFALATNRIDARVEAQVDRIAQGETKVDHATLTALVNGPVSAPHVAANVAGSGLHAGGRVFTAFAVTAQGPANEPFVAARLTSAGDAPNVDAKATIHARGPLEISGIEVGLDRGGEHVKAKVDSVRTAGGVVDVRGAVVEGLGEPVFASAKIGPGASRITAKGERVDIAKIARLVGAESNVSEGTVRLDVDVTTRGDRSTGHAKVDVDGAVLAGMKGKADLHVDSQLDGHRVDLRLTAGASDIGKLSVTADDVELAGAVTDPRAWERATGHVHLETDIALANLDHALPPDTIPVNRLEGTLSVRGDVQLPREGGTPDLTVHVATRGFAISTKPAEVRNPDGTVSRAADPIRSEGIDLALDAKVVGASGMTTVDASLIDRAGHLVDFGASLTAPIAAIRARPGDAAALLKATPVKARIAVPERSLADLPAMVGKLPVTGRAALEIDATGTMRAPRVTFHARTVNIRDANKKNAIPVSADTELTYDGETARLQLVATRPEGKVIEADSALKVRITDVLDHKGNDPLPWEASAAVRFSKFPLEAVTTYAQQDIQGDLSGKIELKDLHRAAGLEANLDFNDLTINEAKFKHANAAVTMRDGTIDGGVRVEQTDGFVDVRAKTAMSWGEDIAPQLDETKPIDVTIKAKAFRLAAVQPFVRDTFSILDGRLEADAKLHVQPGGKQGQMEGAIVLHDGRFEMPTIGEEFHNVHARVIMRPWGTLRFDQIQAEGLTGRMRAEGVAQLEGLTFKQAQGSITIAQNEAVPLSLEGVSLGEAWGNIDATARMDEQAKRMTIDVRIPRLHVKLPQSSNATVQPLDPEPTIKVGMREKDGDLALLPLGPPAKADAKRSDSATSMHLAVHLGNDIELRRDTTVRIRLTGTPVVDIDKETKVSGQIHLTEGFLELQGKRFRIERGTVNFAGQEPSNPVVVATAYWDAPGADTRVYADFVGPVKTGKLTLRSEPKLSEGEILSLLLFGSKEGMGGNGAPSQENDSQKAAGLAGGVLTQGLNKAISGVSNVDVTTRVDTSEKQNPRPQVEVQLTKTVSAEVTQNLGVTPPGQNPDKTLLAVDWRFVKNWSVTSTLGDRGTSIVDLTWKYRY